MSRPFAIALATSAMAAAAVAAPAVHAADYKLGALTIHQPWSRPAQAGMNGVGFMTVANAGKTPVTLLRMETPAAARVEIHQSAMVNGVMTMRELENGVVIPAGGQVAFAPGGYHFMILSLKNTLKVGQKVPAALVFDNGKKAQIDLAVQLTPPAGGQTPPASEHRH